MHGDELAQWPRVKGEERLGVCGLCELACDLAHPIEERGAVGFAPADVKTAEDRSEAHPPICRVAPDHQEDQRVPDWALPLQLYVAVSHMAVGEPEPGRDVLCVQDHASPAGEGVYAADDLEQATEVCREAAVGDHEATFFSVVEP